MRGTIITIILFLVFAVSCNEQAEVSPTKKNTVQKVQVTSLSREPQLERVLNAAGFFSSSLSGRANSSGIEIDVENIIKLLQADSIYSSYAFEISQEKESHGFSNLIIEEFEQGYLGFIVNYESETIFTGMSSFTGKVNRTTLNGELLAEMYFENGRFLSSTTTSDPNGKVLLTGLCLTDVEVTKECTPSEELSTATGLPNEHIQECVTVTTYTYEYCNVPDPWGNYIIGGLGSGPIGTGTVGGVSTSGGGTNTSETPTYSDDAGAENNIVPIIDSSKPKNVPVIEPDFDVWPTDLVLNLPAPGDIITDINAYLKCFDLNAGAKVTIYVDQPTADSRDTWSGAVTNPDVGHTFISIQQGNITRVLGFYPSQGVSPFSPSEKSVLVEDASHPYDINVEITVTAAQLKSVINLAKAAPKNYNLNTYNCTDFGSQISAAAGFSIKNTDGAWPGGGGSNPGDFGQDLRAMSSTSNAKINKASGTGASNGGTCN